MITPYSQWSTLSTFSVFIPLQHPPTLGMLKKKNISQSIKKKNTCKNWQNGQKGPGFGTVTHAMNKLVGGFSPTPSETYVRQNWIISPSREMNIKKICELPPPRKYFKTSWVVVLHHFTVSHLGPSCLALLNGGMQTPREDFDMSGKSGYPATKDEFVRWDTMQIANASKLNKWVWEAVRVYKVYTFWNFRLLEINSKTIDPFVLSF